MNKAYQQGILFILVYVLLSSAQAVYLSNYFQFSRPEEALFVSFILVVVFFSLLRIRHFSKLLQKTKESFSLITIFNFVTAGSWFGYFYAIKYLEPAVSKSITRGLLPLVTLAFAIPLRPQAKPLNLEVVAAIGILAGSSFLGVSAFLGHSSLGEVSSLNLTLGFLAALLSVVSQAGILICSKKLHEKKWVSSEIMIMRSPLVILLSFLILFKNSGLSSILEIKAVLPLFFVTFAGVIIPLYSLQLGIARLEPTTTAALISLEPVITLLMQLFDSRLKISFQSVIGVCSISIFAMMAAYAQHRFKIRK